MNDTDTKPPEQPPANFNGRRFATKQELADYLRCSTRQIEKLVKRGILPIRKLGRRFARFDIPRCEAALAKYDRAAIGEGQ
jgi:excisionase family DNA binding protein